MNPCKLHFTMSLCAVINCINKTNRKVSYFRLPKDTSVHKDWIHATGCPADNLPSKIFACPDHFEEKCFDPSWKLQNELYYKDHKISWRLLVWSLPTLLSHKKYNKPCLFPEKRALAQKKEKVIYCFNKVVTKVSSVKLQALRLLLYWKKELHHRFFSKILSKFPKFWNLANI